MKTKPLYLLVLLLSCQLLFAQNKIDIKANFNITEKTITVNQFISYTNSSRDTLSTIYLNDWSNSFSTKSTPLANRFTEEFSTNFHFAKNEERGYTVITSINDELNHALSFNRLENQVDVISVNLNKVLLPNESFCIHNGPENIPSTRLYPYLSRPITFPSYPSGSAPLI